MPATNSTPLDVAIIGGGHNGLVCACYLAAKGLRVRVFERRHLVGGAAVTEEFHPGFRNSTASYTVSLLNPKAILFYMAFLPLFCGGISCIVGGMLCNSMVAKHGKQRWVRAVFPVSGYIVAAISMCLIPFVKSPTQAIILMCIAEAAHDFGQGANWSTIVDVGGGYAGVAAGLINTIGNMGNAFQPAIGAEIVIVTSRRTPDLTPPPGP